MPGTVLGISGCTLWLKGDAGCYKVANTTLCANGDFCVQWQDQSGDSHHATGGSPVYTTGISPSLLPVLDFQSAIGMSAGYSVAAPYTIFVVYLVNSTSGNHRAVQGSNNWLIGPRAGFHTHFAGGFVSGTGMAVVLNAFVRAYVTNSGSASHVTFNGTDFTTSTSPVTAPGTLDLAATGGAPSEGLGTNAPTPGYIGEVLVYNSVLGSTDLATVDAYLARWQNPPAPSGNLFRQASMDGLGSGGPFFGNPLTRL